MDLTTLLRFLRFAPVLFAMMLSLECRRPQSAVARGEKGNREEAEEALRKTLVVHPCDRKARQELVDHLDTRGRKAEALSESRAWITTCPDEAIEAHCTYQNLRLDLGERDALLDEYRVRLSEHPETAANHYLYGRLLYDPGSSLPENEQALRLDPKLSRARVAIGLDLLALERYSEAFAELSQAIALPDSDPEIAPDYAEAAVGAGVAGTAAAAVELLERDHPDDPNLRVARWILTMGSRHWDQAEKIVESILKRDPMSDLGWYWRARLLQLSDRRQELERFLEESKGREDLAGRIAGFRFELMLEDGHFKKAVSELGKASSAIDSRSAAIYWLYAAAALLMEGDRAGARKVLDDFEPKLKRARFAPRLIASFRAMAEALRGNLPAEQLLQQARADYRVVKDALFMMGACTRVVGDLSTARDLFARSERACLNQTFPLPLARKLAAE